MCVRIAILQISSQHTHSRDGNKQGTLEQSLKLNPGWHHTVAFSPIHLLLGGGGQHTQAVREQQGGGGRAKSAHAPIGCRPVTRPRVTVTMSFCEQGRSSFVHFSGRQEHNRTPSAPSAVLPLVEARGGCICKDTQAKHGVSTEGTGKRERSEKDWPARFLTGLAQSGEHPRQLSIGRAHQVSIKCGSARKPTELCSEAQSRSAAASVVVFVVLLESSLAISYTYPQGTLLRHPCRSPWLPPPQSTSMKCFSNHSKSIHPYFI